MWHREFRDYKTDAQNVKYHVESGRGICGCEMHEINGWGNSLHTTSKKRRKGLFAMIRKWSKE